MRPRMRQRDRHLSGGLQLGSRSAAARLGLQQMMTSGVPQTAPPNRISSLRPRHSSARTERANPKHLYDISSADRVQMAA